MLPCVCQCFMRGIPPSQIFIAFKDLFPTGSHYFFIIVLLRKNNNTITLIRRQRPLLCALWRTKLTLYVTCWTFVLLSFLMTWSVLLCFMYNAMYYKREEGRFVFGNDDGILTDWRFLNTFPWQIWISRSHIYPRSTPYVNEHLLCQELGEVGGMWNSYIWASDAFSYNFRMPN